MVSAVYGDALKKNLVIGVAKITLALPKSS